MSAAHHKPVGDELEPVTLPDRVARMYLEMDGEWDLPPLAGICTAPLLSADGKTRTATGYDPVTQLWCTNLPTLRMPGSSYPRGSGSRTATFARDLQNLSVC